MGKRTSPLRYAPITDINPVDGPPVTCVDTAPRRNRKKRLVALILHMEEWSKVYEGGYHLAVMAWAPQHQRFLSATPYPLVDGRVPFPTLSECKAYLEHLFRN